MAVVKHGNLEPKGDEVGVLGRGGPMWISETEPNKHSARAGGKGPPTTGVRWSRVSLWDHKGGGYCRSSDKNLAIATDLSVSKYVKDNGNQVSHCQRREFQNMEREKTRVRHVTLDCNLKYEFMVLNLFR